MRRFKGMHSDAIRSCAYSPDGSTLCLTSDDKTASIVDTATGMRIYTLEGMHSDRITSCAYSPDGSTLCLTSDDKMASITHLDVRTMLDVTSTAELPRWLTLPRPEEVVAVSKALSPSERAAHFRAAVDADPWLPNRNGGALFRELILLDDMYSDSFDCDSFKAIVDDMYSGDTTPVLRMPPDETGRSLLRLAAERQPPNRAIITDIRRLVGTSVTDAEQGYYYTVFFDLAPTLADDLVFIFKYADTLLEPVLVFLEEHGLAPAPEHFQLGSLKITPKRIEIRHCSGGADGLPFARLGGVQATTKPVTEDHDSATVATEVMFVMIPGLTQPAKDPDLAAGDERKIGASS
jgi:hypothetical protein